jgi:hypothetical protein
MMKALMDAGQFYASIEERNLRNFGVQGGLIE